MRQPLDLRLDALDEIGEPVDDRLQQADQDGGAALEVRLGAVAARHIDGEGPRLRIAHGDEALAGEDEGDGRRPRLPLLGLIQQGRGHEIRAVLLIEAARRLDLLLLLARRHVELERPLDLFSSSGVGLRRSTQTAASVILGLPFWRSSAPERFS